MTASRLGAALAVAAGSLATWLPGGGVRPLAAAPACPPAAHHAEVVVEHSGGSTVAACVGFSAATITGEAAVRVSGIEYDMQPFGSYGEAVCQLDHEPQTVPSSCFGSDAYWELFVSRGCAGWHSSGVGVSSLQLADGDLEGFHYVSSGAGGPPPGPSGYCPPVAPSPSASPPPPPPPTAAASRTTSGVSGATQAPSARGTLPSASFSATTPTPRATPALVPPTEGVVALAPDTAPPSPAAAGALQRTGAAPPPPASGSPPWGYALGVAVLGGLAGLLAWRLRRRRE